MNNIRPWLYIGKYIETKSAELLNFNNIGSILHLAEKITIPGVNTLYLPVEDGMHIPLDLLQQGVDFVLSQKREGKKVIIACGAGTSRSVAFVMAVLKEDENIGLLEALDDIMHHHPQALPHPALLKSLCNYYKEDIPYSDFLTIIAAKYK